jgi:hypothetical protein
MEYQVPQFIEVEDKIFGPFTFKQFVYIAGGVGLCAIAFFYLPVIFALLVSLPVAAFAGALAFYKVNNKPFEDVLEAGFSYFLGSRLYLWKKVPKSEKDAPSAPTGPVAPPERPKVMLERGKLHDLAWSLDIKDRKEPDTQ